ncbi:uncharacterized protein G2W53_015339 [Senna tora]|uniref:Uncharacterized protein n=1 Tax=Senna tora TaxID=362788 RepID=A0A835C4K0_9FABA|nr:uncharacterized protein G2W53_015339 [Senna tora]
MPSSFKSKLGVASSYSLSQISFGLDRTSAIQSEMGLVGSYSLSRNRPIRIYLPGNSRLVHDLSVAWLFDLLLVQQLKKTSFTNELPLELSKARKMIPS